MGPGQRSQAYGGQSGDLTQEPLEFMQQLQRALGLANRLHGVDARKPRLERNLIVDLGVVLHGATAQGIEMGVDGKIQLAEAGEVLDHLRLRYFRQRQFIPQKSVIGRGLGWYIQIRHHYANPSGDASFQQQFFGLSVAALLHYLNSERAATNESMSFLELISVTHSNMPFGICRPRSRPPRMLRSISFLLISAGGAGHWTTNS